MKDYATLVLVKYAGSFTLRRVILCLRVVIEYGAGLDFFRGKRDMIVIVEIGVKGGDPLENSIPSSF
jgi:hypothetical protein